MQKGRFFERLIWAKSGFLPTFSGFLPTFKIKSGQKKVSICNGLRALCPDVHFFYPYYVIEKLNNIINRDEKSGQVGRTQKWGIYES